ncbi:MAG: hypothetical protein LQ343_003327 [Gyalolechia ehrenbergii]|nr:MAG: hypothetical protein LQ343_003327 [Gyalolechia ehrenbergii]
MDLLTKVRLDAAVRWFCGPNSLQYILALPRDFLDEDQKRRLKRIHEHFADESGPLTNDDDILDNPSTPMSENAPPARSRGRPRTSDASIARCKEWSTEIQKITNLELDDAIQTLIASTPTEASVLTMFKTESVPQSLVKAPTDAELIVRHLFRLLLLHDVASAHPNLEKNERMGLQSTLLEELTNVNVEGKQVVGAEIRQLLEGDNERFGNHLDTARRLSLFCSRMGVACLLYLFDYFDDRMIRRMKYQGKNFEEVSRHLRSLDLNIKALESGADQLGSSMRKILLQSWQHHNAMVVDDEN